MRPRTVRNQPLTTSHLGSRCSSETQVPLTGQGLLAPGPEGGTATAPHSRCSPIAPPVGHVVDPGSSWPGSEDKYSRYGGLTKQMSGTPITSACTHPESERELGRIS